MDTEAQKDGILGVKSFPSHGRVTRPEYIQEGGPCCEAYPDWKCASIYRVLGARVWAAMRRQDLGEPVAESVCSHLSLLTYPSGSLW